MKIDSYIKFDKKKEKKNMSEQDSTSKSGAKNSKRSLSEYLDLGMAAINTIVIIFIFALIRNGIIILVVLGLILLAVLVFGIILTFVKRNPFYIYFCYGLTLCGVLGNFLAFTTTAILWIVFILQGFYVYRLIDINLFLYSRAAKSSKYYVTMKKSQKQVLEEKRREELLEKHRKSIEQKFKFNSIAVISLCCSIGLFLSLIFSA